MNRRTFVHRATTAATIPLAAPLAGFINTDRPAPTGAPVIKRLSWAGVQMELDGTTLFLDALTRDIWNGNRSFPIVPLETENRRRYALVSHLHNDHYDREALTDVLGERGRVICHDSVQGDVLSDGLKIRSVAFFEPLNLGPFTVTPVQAADGTGVPGGQVSWVIRAGERLYFHGGDTMWHGHWWTFTSYFGAFDTVFLPVNGFRLTGRELPEGVTMSMTPVQAATAARILGARAAVPIHYGVTDPEYYLEVPDSASRFRDLATAHGIAVQVLEPGQVMTP